MLIRFYWCAAALVATAAPTPLRAAAAAPERALPGDTARYALTILKSDMRSVQVEARFMLRDTLLYMVGGMDHLPDSWRTFVKNERMMDERGAEIPLRRIDRRRWVVSAKPGTKATLRYTVRIEHDTPPINWFPGPREAAYAREWGVFAIGRALFVFPDPEMTNTVVEIIQPNGWRVAASLPALSGSNKLRTASTRRELTDALFFVGEYVDLRLRQGPLTFDFVMAPSYRPARPLFERVSRTALSAFRDVFNTDPGKTQYLVVANPEVARTDGFGGAFRSGFSMTFPFVPDESNMGIWAFTLTHEVFHLWNAYTISRGSPAEEWFLEGGADYYTTRTLGQRGTYTRAMALGMHARAFSLYGRIAGRVSPAAAGEEESKSGDMLYKGGWTLLAALDLDIRSKTNDSKTLDDVMRLLTKRLAGSATGYRNQDIMEALNATAGADYGDFFARYIVGRERLDLAPYLKMVGLELDGGKLVERADATPAEKARLKAWIGS